MPASPGAQRGLSLAEILVAMAIGALLLAALSGVAGQALRAEAETREHTALESDARLAMQRMTAAVAGTRRLLVPMPDSPLTVLWDESIREPGVLAVTLDPRVDRDLDGFADADNDKDGRVDEDLSKDATADGTPGIKGIDDDNDGLVDEGGFEDDDEDLATDEDNLDGVDFDGDGSVDEDMDRDMNQDGKPGVSGIDDDGDGNIDEGPAEDDDEDGLVDEDWLDAVVYRLSGSTLLERMPDIDPVDGTDYTERVVAENVTTFRVERIPPAAAGLPALVDITLELTGASGRRVKLGTRVRVGGGS